MAAPAAGADAPRAKRARLPKLVLEKDTDGIMDLLEMSRLVRDLCRQHNFDREAWQRSVDAALDHAKRLDRLEHEMLQVNDQVAVVVDGANAIYKASEKKHRDEVMNAMQDIKLGVTTVDEALRKTVHEVQKEFILERDATQNLISDLERKFKTLDAAMVELTKRDEALLGELNKVKVPLLDPNTGVFSGNTAERFEIYTPQRPAASGPQPTGPPTTFGASAAQAAAGGHPRAETSPVLFSTGSSGLPQGPGDAHHALHAQGGFHPGPGQAPQATGAHEGFHAGPGHAPQARNAHGGFYPGPGDAPHALHAQGGSHSGPVDAPHARNAHGGFHPGPGHGHGAPPHAHVGGYQGPWLGHGAHSDHPGHPLAYAPPGIPQSRRLYYDSRIFETKYAQEARNQFNGGKDGASWKALIRGYFVGKLPACKQLLQWAEDRKANAIALGDVQAQAPQMEEDVMVINHLLWAFFNVNLIGEAREIFGNVEDSNGLEVWRRIINKINDRGERRRDELYELIHHPKGTNRCEDVARVLEEWDTNQRLFREAGGEGLRDEERRRIVKKIVPEIIVNQLILQTQEFKSWEDMKEYVREKARLMAVNASTKPLHSLELEVDLDDFVDLSLDDAILELGEHATSENIMALVIKKQQRKISGGGRAPPWKRPPGAGAGSGRDGGRAPGGGKAPGPLERRSSSFAPAP